MSLFPESPSPSAQRRGVLLLISLVMLSLFLLLGTSYIIIVQRRKVCAVPTMLGSITRTIARESSEKVGDDILRGQQPTPGSGVGFTADERINSYYLNSVLSDKYGSMFDPDGRIWDHFKGGALTRFATTAPFFWFEMKRIPANEADGYYTGIAPASRGPAAAAANRPQDSLNGRILSINIPDEPNAVFRIIASRLHPALNDGTILLLLYSTNPEINYSNGDVNGRDVYVQGREFSGRLSDLNESYDAPDDLNIFLAWEQAEAALGRDQIPNSGDEPHDGYKYNLPSFHRPDKILAAMKEKGSSFAAEFASQPDLLQLRPLGKMSFHPDGNWPTMGFASTPAAPSGNALEHPNFTGSNVRTIGGTKYYFDPVNGPWDVDNDGDGITDSVWLDVGLPQVELDNQVCKPLVALKIVDLDGRINLNAHGTLTDLAYGTSAFGSLPPASGIYYAGTDPANGRTASVPRGLGHGVAEINLRHLLPDEFDLVGPRLFSGTQISGTQFTPSGIRIESSSAEGRYGDSIAGTGLLLPAPGRLDVNDLSIQLPPTDQALAQVEQSAKSDVYGTNLRPAFPVAPRGVTRVGLDQLGQPVVSRTVTDANDNDVLDANGNRISAWVNDEVDDPYDMSLGRTAPKPGWDYDPNSQPSSLQDNLYSAAQLERLLRLYDPNSTSLSARIASLLGPAAEVGRMTATTESWDSTAICVPQEILYPLLALSDQWDNQKDSLVSWDAQMGIRMDLNRPFGNGRDDNANGVVDEPAEIAEELNGLSGITQYSRFALTNGRDVDGDGDARNDQDRARELFARHLYVLVRYLCPNVPADEAAQWAVNVVDFRDHDTVMTRFQYDETFQYDQTSDPDLAAWNVDPATSPVVWGCERPELLITESISWRSVEEKLDTDNGATAQNPYYSWEDLGLGGLMFELYHPWTGQTDQGLLAQRTPAEFLRDTSSAFQPSAGVDLAKTNPSGEPIFQLAIVEDTQANLDELQQDPAWPLPDQQSGTYPSLERVIYLGPDSTTVVTPDRYGEAFVYDTSATPADDASTPQQDESNGRSTVSPGQFAVISGGVEVNPGSYLLPVELASPLTGVVFGFDGYSQKAVDPTNGADVDITLGFDDNVASQPFVLSTPLQETIRGTFPDGNDTARDYSYRMTASRLPADVTAGPVGAVVQVFSTTAPGSNPLRLAPTNTLTDPAAALKKARDGKYRVLLRRLADPMKAYDDATNPYITIDSMIFHDQAVISNASDPASSHTLTSTERGSGVVDENGDFDPLANNLWKQDDADVTPSNDPGNNPAAPGTYPAKHFDPTTGQVTTTSLQYCGAVSQSDTIEWSMGFLPWRLKIPAPGDTATPPFPWLTWLNRDYLSPSELLLVPRSSPFTLLRQHSHQQPFSHLFFHYGDAASPIVPADRLGILEFLRTSSPYADSEQWISATDGDAVTQASIWANGGRGFPMFLYPHNRMNLFREPGRINLNTMSSPRIWSALTDGRPAAPYEDEIHYDGSNAPLKFAGSEDWQRASTAPTPTPAEVGNWNLDETDSDGDGKLSLNHDANNDGKQTISDSSLSLRSLAASRRGWPISSSPLTTTINGLFSRELNRSSVTTTNRWFATPFQSGWQPATTTSYSDNRSVLMRQYSDSSSGSSSFQWGFTHVNAANADIYLISSQGMKKYAEGGGITYWGPTANDSTGELIYQIPLQAPLVTASMNCSLPCWDYTRQSGGQGRGASSLEVSRDGNTWITLTDNLNPLQYQTLAESTRFNGLLPSALAGSSEIWLRIRLRTTSTPVTRYANAQFGRSTSSATNEVFSLSAELSTNESNLLFQRHSDIVDGSGNKRPDRSYADASRNPYFHYRDILKLANTTTSRSNVFAVWMTVGFFHVEDHPTMVGEQALAEEHGLDTGNVARHRAFMIIDRSIPVGFHPNYEFNSRETHLIKRDTE